jgi:hypothetical protein
MNNETMLVEINGVKMEVDLRHAKVVHENLRVGSKVKLLEKGSYSGPQVYPGVVIGFENFQSLPTIIVAYVKSGYLDAGMSIAYINGSDEATKKWEMVPSYDDDLPVRKADILANFDRESNKKRAELEDIEAKRSAFLRYFGVYFGETETV